jgi:hypothetical protein
MIADVSEDAGKRGCGGEQVESFFELSGGNCDGEATRIHMERTGCGAGRGLLFNALPLPSPYLFPIHLATPDLSCFELACSFVVELG